MSSRIYIFGPSCSGTSTLGKLLAKELNYFHVDTDDYYWKKTEVAYTEVVPIEQRVESILAAIENHESWVISGCMCSWGGDILSQITHVIYQWEDWSVRKQRLIEREERRFGKESFAPGGEREALFKEFLDWASKYDTAGTEMRSRKRHEAWLSTLDSSVSVTRFESMPDVSAHEKLTTFMEKLKS